MCARFAAILFLALNAIGFCADRCSAAELSATLKVEVEGQALAGLPLRLKLTIANTGKSPFSYWCGGPGTYPSADPFTATLTDAKKQTRTLRLRNGQYVQGSGVDLLIETVQVLPAVCDPLPAGTYTLAVTGKSSSWSDKGKLVETWPAVKAADVTITVENNPQAVKKAETALLDSAKEDPFARYVVQTYGIDPIVKTWLEQLLDDDAKVAFRAVGTLRHVRRLPEGGGDLLKRAALKHCDPKFGAPDANLLYYISLIARNTQTDEALEAVITIANADADARFSAISDLGYFPQKRAEEVLLALTTKKDSAVYWRAIGALACRKNPIALAPLLKAVADRDPNRRREGLGFLSCFRDTPEAQRALKSALKDADPDVRNTAELALKSNFYEAKD
jgi:hypothetical protein